MGSIILTILSTDWNFHVLAFTVLSNAGTRTMPGTQAFTFLISRTASPRSPQVSGYTNQQIFNYLQPDVTRMSDFKAKLFTLYGTTQQTAVNSLSASYASYRY